LEVPMPDFNINRKCQNHDEILKWQPIHPITLDQMLSLTPPNDAVWVPKSKHWTSDMKEK
jgi:hypothetical protein